MKKSTKIALGVIGGVIILGGLGTWLYFKNKNKSDEQNGDSLDKGSGDASTKPNYSTGSSSESASNDDFPLKRGSRGERVAQLQKLLVCYGSLPNKESEIDGIWGARTENAMQSQPVRLNLLKNQQDFSEAMSRLLKATDGGRDCQG